MGGGTGTGGEEALYEVNERKGRGDFWKILPEWAPLGIVTGITAFLFVSYYKSHEDYKERLRAEVERVADVNGNGMDENEWRGVYETVGKPKYKNPDELSALEMERYLGKRK